MPVSVSNNENTISFVYSSGQVSDDISSETNFEPSISGGMISYPNPWPYDSAMEENDSIQAIKPKQKTHPIFTSKRMDITISHQISINRDRSF